MGLSRLNKLSILTHFQKQKMLEITFFALLCYLSFHQKVLIASSPFNTFITTHQRVVFEPYHSYWHPGMAGYGASWIWAEGGHQWPEGYTLTFQTYFYTDCPNADLRITADDQFEAKINDEIRTGNRWDVLYYHKLFNLNCGTNKLQIKVINHVHPSPAALIFAVLLIQGECYKCLSPASFYNYKTCRCECNSKDDCGGSNSAKLWLGYPTCGCDCKSTLNCSNQYYWNKKSCACECKYKQCPTGQIQSTNTCNCIKQCAQNELCQSNQIWSFDECRCVCRNAQLCTSNRFWDGVNCSCSCLAQSNCLQHFQWNENLCKCQQILCSDGFYLDQNNCSKCPRKCLSCQSAQICSSCIKKYFLNNNICKTCPVECQQCSNSLICSSCITNFYLENSTCKSCPDGCIQCQNILSCFSCIKKYYLSNSTCKNCPTECEQCQNYFSCSSCTKSNYLINNTCKSCPIECEQCFNRAYCSSCVVGFYLENNTCKSCSVGCKQCLNSSYCSSCASGYYLYQLACHLQQIPCYLSFNEIGCLSCTRHLALSEQMPYQCTCNFKCKKCNGYQCQICQDGYYLREYQLYSNLSKSFSYSYCQFCSIGNCIQCLTSNFCVKCREGYKFQNISNSSECISFKTQQCLNDSVASSNSVLPYVLGFGIVGVLVIGGILYCFCAKRNSQQKNGNNQSCQNINYGQSQLNKSSPCSICLDENQITDTITQCRHSFHLRCIVEWNKRNNNCPYCRTRIDRIQWLCFKCKNRSTKNISEGTRIICIACCHAYL